MEFALEPCPTVCGIATHLRASPDRSAAQIDGLARVTKVLRQATRLRSRQPFHYQCRTWRGGVAAVNRMSRVLDMVPHLSTHDPASCGLPVDTSKSSSSIDGADFGQGGWLFRWRLANPLAGLFLPHDDPPRTLDACRNGLGLAATRAKGET